MYSSAKPFSIVNVRLTHKTAHVPLLEAVSFKDKAEAYNQIRRISGVEESVLIQTCNRIELYLVSQNGQKTAESAIAYLASRAAERFPEALGAIECAVDRDALSHLLKVTSGLESMVIGEDQVINQVWNSYLEAENADSSGPVLSLLFNRAVNVGRRVRSKTGIGKGAVSVGSAAVELAENLLGSLNDRKILIMGAGETGTLVAKAMARRCLSPIFIANRTYQRAERLAEELRGKAVKFKKLNEVLTDADVVFCSTSAPHYLLTKKMLTKLLKTRQNKNDLLVIDISNPRNVEENINQLSNVKLYNIDDLSLITERNMEQRQKSVRQANGIIETELLVLERAVKEVSVAEIISKLLSQAEEIRQRELAKTLGLMDELDERQRKIVNDLTKILLKQTFLPVVENFRRAAAENQTELVEAASELLEIKKES